MCEILNEYLDEVGFFATHMSASRRGDAFFVVLWLGEEEDGDAYVFLLLVTGRLCMR